MKVLISESLEDLRAFPDLASILDGGLEKATGSLTLRFEDIDVKFDAASLLDGKNAPMSDLEASRRIYSTLNFLSPVGSTDERIWVTLAFGPYLDYCKLRWPTKANWTNDEIANHVRNHWFCHTPRMRFRDHPLSSAWWKQHYIRSVAPNSIYQAEKVLFEVNSDLPVQFLGRPNLASIPNIALALIELFFKRYVEDGRQYERLLVRELLKMLDISAGSSIPSLTSYEDASALVRQKLALATASGSEED